MKSRSFVIKQASQFSQEVSRALADGFNPDLAVIFSSVDIGLPGLQEALHDLPFQVAGCSTCGEIFLSGDSNGVYQHSLVATLIETRGNYFKTRLFDGTQVSSYELGKQAGEWGKSQFEKPSFLILVSGLSANGQEIVEGILDSAGYDTIIFGGLAGDDSAFKETFVFDNQRLLNNGISVIAFDDSKVLITGIASSGWVGIGSDKMITEAKGNIVYTIDHKNALDVYLESLSINENDLPEIGVEYPLLIKRNGKEILRAVVGVNKEDRSLIFAGTVPKGSLVTFSTSPGFEVVEHTKTEIRKFHDLNPDFDLLILFSCMARHLALGPVISEEIETAFRRWGKPVSGYFCYGEIGTNINQQCDFYNETFTLAGLKER